jgi:site-specific DNA-cytosine methylase
MVSLGLSSRWIQTLELHLETGTISPLHCEHFDHGVKLNHPISLNVSTMDIDMLLAGFSCQGFDKNAKRSLKTTSQSLTKPTDV